MCSLTESELEPELVKGRLDPSKLRSCKKCPDKKPAVNLRVNDVYCRDCFLTGVHHKFRATLGKHKAMKPGEKVVVGYSGGGASAALLHLLKTGIESDHKRLLFKPEVLHIDEGCLLNLTPEKRLENIRRAAEDALVSGFPFHFSILEKPSEVFTVEDLLNLQIKENLGQILYDSVSNIKENSAKEDFINTIRRRALIEGAEQLKSKKIFTAECATKVSIDLLTGVSMGKGINLAHETGFRDTRDDVTILRPLRDVSGKELAIYTQMHRIRFHPAPNVSTGQEALFSIRKLTEEFLVGLQADFPATLSTVFRTGDKLQVDPDSDEEACILCRGPLDTDAEEHCALQATYWSQIVSSKGKNLDPLSLVCDNLNKLALEELRAQRTRLQNGDACNIQPDSECCGQGDGSCKTNSVKPVRLEDILPLVCYSCMRTITNFRSVDKLPMDILDEVNRSSNRRAMKDQIADFLL